MISAAAFGRWLARVLALGALGLAAVHAAGAPPARVEARSADLLAVGVAHGNRMTIHLSRLLDNAPVRDAVLSVVLRGVAHPTTVDADGSYALVTDDLALPGAAALEFRVTEAGAQQTLKVTLQIDAGGGPAPDSNNARQLWWWVLNFAVCIGFLYLISRRRKSAAS